MTDASLSVTQSVVERFTDEYLRSCGCAINKHGRTWSVRVLEEAETDLVTDGLTIACGDDTDLPEGEVELLHPESAFFDELLSEATQRAPTGKISLTAQNHSVESPEWIRGKPVTAQNIEFVPYYDRTALLVVFRVSIETVSEYEQSFIRAIAIDTRSKEPLPGIETSFLDYTDPRAGSDAEGTQISIPKTDVKALLEEARSIVVNRIGGQIDEIHQEASRAADAEVEEYRKMKEQQLEELEDRRMRLSSKLNGLESAVNDGNQEERMEALKERKQLRHEYEEVDDSITDLRQRRNQGFPEQQQEIRDRHALNVRVVPLTLTEIEYERGEIELELAEEGHVHTITVGYGTGVGITESVYCSICGEQLTEETPLGSILGGLRCEDCVENF